MTKTSQKLFDLCREYGVRDLYVFGSRTEEISAMVRTLPLSQPPTDADVDIGILPESSTHWNTDKKVNWPLNSKIYFMLAEWTWYFCPRRIRF